MPLRKLWNSIRGNGDTSVAKPAETAAVNPSDSSTATTEAQPVLRATIPIAAATPQAGPSQSKPVKQTLSREDKKLCRRIESMSFQSILEISVGDGARALSLLQTNPVKQSDPPVHYIAIDEFEMGGNSLSLRGFHKQLREHHAKAHLVPMPIDAGLDRVVRTFGQVDLIIWSADQAPTAAQQHRIARLSKPGTILFSLDQGRWSETLSGASAAVQTRRAA
ncbi:hypothetical protein NHH03_18470 [Stieleria sp. TO1_6]|uniref:hypothetical protein n=1 Tax=Stieleria tagensis TaxID=2956795 RepID=UPI00209ADA90|nr:hypothetical protein [Stieleria tagensis]MCO8123737.1 hypothetical protein [Stieleria tagensis]